jgi:hypothetical protein
VSERAARKKRKRRPAARPPTAPAPPGPDRRQWFAAFVLLALLCGALYGRTVGFGFTRTDDTVQLVDNAHFVASLDNLPAAFTRPFFGANGAANYYRPVVALSYMLDAQWTGIQPWGYHLTNVLIHLAAAFLFFVTARHMGFAAEPSLGAAAVLAAHPALTEAVAWVPGRGDSLLAIWFLAAFLCLLRWLATGHWLPLVAHTAFLSAVGRQWKLRGLRRGVERAVGVACEGRDLRGAGLIGARHGGGGRPARRPAHSALGAVEAFLVWATLRE